MNAPKTPDAVLQLDAELVPVDVIIPSSTHIQQSRRKRFSQEAILELAASIATSGVINPILVRPFPEELKAHISPTPKYELVAGERRWLATKRAGLAHIPAVIRPLDDGQVLEAQLVENLQRADLNPLEEAEGYQELKALKGYDAERIGELIGKSKSYVYARMKLNELAHEAREALEQGQLDFSKALLVARFSSAKLQKAAVKKLIDYGGARLAYTRAFELLRDSFMVNLAAAPFAHDDATFFRMVKVPGRRGVEEPIALPACTLSISNSANDAELQRDLGSAHMCIDKDCFQTKVAQFWERKRAEAERTGRTVLSGDEAAAAVPEAYDGFNANYLDLDAPYNDAKFPEPEPGEGATEAEQEAWDIRSADWEPPTYRQLLGADVPLGVLAQSRKGELRELLPLKDARALLKAKGVTIKVPSWMKERTRDDTDDEAPASAAERQAEHAKEQERRAVELEFRLRLLRTVKEKCKGPFKRPDLERIADWLNNDGYGDAQEALYPGGIRPEKATEAELFTFIIVAMACGEADDTYRKPGALLELAQRFKIDAKSIRAQVVKDLKPTSAPAADDEQAKPTAKKAPAKKKAAAKK